MFFERGVLSGSSVIMLYSKKRKMSTTFIRFHPKTFARVFEAVWTDEKRRRRDSAALLRRLRFETPHTLFEVVMLILNL